MDALGSESQSLVEHAGFLRALARGQRSNSGLAVALFSMALTASAFYWVTERSDRVSQATDQRMKELAQGQLDADSRAMQRSGELEGRFLALEERLKLAAEDASRAQQKAPDDAGALRGLKIR